jgi:hypothetical protein
MVTKNEMVAILAALTTDFDKASRRAEEDVRKEEQAHNDATYFEPKTGYSERRHAG